MNKPVVRLTGVDGNAFNILGICIRAGKANGWTKEEQDQFYAEATSGDYNHLLRTAMNHFDVE